MCLFNICSLHRVSYELFFFSFDEWDLPVTNIIYLFFILIFLGSALSYFNFLNIHFYTGLSKFAFYIAMPAYIGLAIAEANFNNYFNYQFLINYETVTIIIFCFSAFVSILLIKTHKNEIGILA